MPAFLSRKSARGCSGNNGSTIKVIVYTGLVDDRVIKRTDRGGGNE